MAAKGKIIGDLQQCSKCAGWQQVIKYRNRETTCQTCHNVRRKKARRKDVIGELVRAAKSRCAKNGREFSITAQDVVLPKRCPILNIPFKKNKGSGPCHASPSLDRRDNTLGYVPGNVFVISHLANSLKHTMSIMELKTFCERMLVYINREQTKSP